MTAFISRLNKGAMLPEISPRANPAEKEKEDRNEVQMESLMGPENMKKLRKFENGDSDSEVAVVERMPGALHDPDDEAEKKMKQLEKTVNERAAGRQKLTMKLLNAKETRPEG